MNKLKVLDLVAIVAMAGTVYYTVYKTSIIAGALLTVAHLTYELSGYLQRKVANKEYNEFMDKLYAKAIQDNSQQSEDPPQGNC